MMIRRKQEETEMIRVSSGLKVALIAAIVCCFSLTTHAQNTRCTLRAEQAPTLRGFRLGMTIEELRAMYPAIQEYAGAASRSSILITPADEYGRTSVSFTAGEYSVYDREAAEKFKAVQRVELKFLDRKIISIQVTYDDSVKWNNGKEFLNRVTEALKLPNAWKADDTEDHWTTTCDGFQVEVMFNGYTPGVLISDTTSSDTIKKRIAAKEEKERQTFTP